MAREVWVLSQEWPPATEPGLSWLGVFSSRAVALAYLREVVLGPELADKIDWDNGKDVPGHNPDFWNGWLEVDDAIEPQQLYTLTTTPIDADDAMIAAEVPPGTGTRSDALTASLAEMVDLVLWMSGSGDFGPTSVAGWEWQRRYPTVEHALELLKEVEPS